VEGVIWDGWYTFLLYTRLVNGTVDRFVCSFKRTRARLPSNRKAREVRVEYTQTGHARSNFSASSGCASVLPIIAGDFVNRVWRASFRLSVTPNWSLIGERIINYPPECILARASSEM